MQSIYPYRSLSGRRCSRHELSQVGHGPLAPAVVMFQFARFWLNEPHVQQLVGISLVGVVGRAHDNAVLVALVSQVNRLADLCRSTFVWITDHINKLFNLNATRENAQSSNCRYHHHEGQDYVQQS